MVPKIPSYRITDLAEAIGPECRKVEIGIRPGEKIHEEMITSADSYTTVDLGKYYSILPQKPMWSKNKYMEHFKAKSVVPGFEYNSGTNDDWLSVEELREFIAKYVDSDFQVFVK